MARPLRIEYPGAYYHVINRENNQEKIFKNKAREVAIYLARDMTGITCKDLGEYFGEVSGALTLLLHKQHGKEWLIICYYLKFHIGKIIMWIPLLVNSKVWIDFSMLSNLRESRRTSDPALSRIRGKLLQLHP